MREKHEHYIKRKGQKVYISATYHSWKAMKTRCYNLNTKDYHRYGARGISVCDNWKNSFLSFLSDMGERPEGTTLDRINPNKGYYPENCRWATMKEQQNNKRPRRRESCINKLSIQNVQAIKHGLSLGVSRKELAQYFKVSTFAITDIALKRTFSDI